MEHSQTTPVMTTLAGRPINLLHTPSRDLLLSCRTATGDDVYVPLSALLRLFIEQEGERTGGTDDGHN